MIPASECKHGGLYRISSRNLSFGVFNSHHNGFVGIREKYGNYYLFTEFAWECGPPYGTVIPMEYLEDYHGEPVEYLNATTKEDIEKFLAGNTSHVENTDLFNWLEIKEKQYGERQ
jgi:hypothetical protein